MLADRQTRTKTDRHGHHNTPLPYRRRSNKAMVHCRLRPRCPLHRGSVYSRRPPSSRTRRNQHHAAGALACARRRNDVTRCNGIDTLTCGPLYANMTSSTKPEVRVHTYHNAAKEGPSHSDMYKYQLSLMGLLQLRYEHDSSTIRARFGYNTLQHATRFFVRSHTRSIRALHENQW